VTRYCWRCAAALAAREGGAPVICVACGQAHYANPKPCGDAVVVSDGQVLLLRRAHEPEAGAWDVPGGFCEADEHPMHAAERELTEELGLRGRAVAYIGTWMDVYGPPEPDGTVIHTAAGAYVIELEDPGQPPTLQPEEALEARWFPLDRLPQRLAFAAHARPMLDAAAAIIAGTATPLPDRTW
jgi:8-oxo-dGTP diphosphatase